LKPAFPIAAHVVRLRSGFDRQQFISASSDRCSNWRCAPSCSSCLAGGRMMRAVLLMGLVKGYRLLLSPWLGSSCRFEPTCSAYALRALDQPWRCGRHLSDRSAAARCHPFCAGGHDPVPAQIEKPRLFTHLLSPFTSKKSS
jgi:putative membrane protein insertion efficiency factor